MHISNIPETDQWGTEVSILLGVVGVILLGKLPLYKFDNFQVFEIRVQYFLMRIHICTYTIATATSENLLGLLH